MESGAPEDQVPERKIVLHPRTAAARQQGRRSSVGRRTRGYVADSERVFELVAAQRRHALRSLLILLVLIFGLPTLLILAPDLTDLPSGPLPPLHWVVAGIGLYSTLAIIGWLHERKANALDRRWVRERAEP